MQYQTEYLHKNIVAVCLCNRAVKSLLQISNASGQNFPNFSYLLLNCIELQNHCSLVFSSPLRMQRQAYAGVIVQVPCMHYRYRSIPSVSVISKVNLMLNSCV